MPKKTNLTANNLKQRPGWFPPIPDISSRDADYYGTADFYKDPKMREYFHTILKQNFGFDFEADPQDVKKRIVITSKVGKLAMDDYLKNMEEISLMPDSPEKLEEYHKAAGAIEAVLYQQLAKGRLVFIPLGETEPRQLRYNPNTGEYQLSGKLTSLLEFQKINDAFLPRDKKGNLILQKKEALLKPEHPGEFKLYKPNKPEPMKEFNEYLPDKPVMEEMKPLREEPKAPEEVFKDGKTKQELIEEEFKRISEGVVKPEYKKVDIPVPRFTFKEPEKIEKPNLPRTDLQEPVIPAIENEIKRVEEQMNAAPPALAPGIKRIFNKKPVPVEEPFKPVLENPEPPQEPEYIKVPKEPVFKHPVQPQIELELPNWSPRKKPDPPDQPVFLLPPDEPTLRTEPEEPQRPGFFRRLLSSASVREYEARHREWETDHNAWVQESNDMPRKLAEYKVACDNIQLQNEAKMNDFNASVNKYFDELDAYNRELKQYESELKDLESINQVHYDDFNAKLIEYKEARENLGDQYDLDYQEFLTEHAKWENDNKELLEKNEKMKQDYENSPEYKKYVEEQKWYDTHIRPTAFEYDKVQELRNKLKAEYEEKLENYNAYLKADAAYQKELDSIEKAIEEDDREKNGNNPDYELNKEARIKEKIAENMKANEDYDKVLDEHKAKMEHLYDVHTALVNKEEHIQYVKAKEEFDRNEALRTKKVIVKKQVPDESGIDLNVNYDELDEEAKNKLGEKLDPILTSENQPLPSEKISIDEYNEIVIENENEDALNYSVVEDMLFDNLDKGDLQENAQKEEKMPELKEDEEIITLYDYEVRRFEAFEKDQKYYNLMKKRYDEKKAEYEQKKIETDEWNNSVEKQISEYDERIRGLRIVAQNNVNQRIQTYEERKQRYEKDHEKWVEEAKDYNQKKDKIETEYILKLHTWNKEKEVYDKKKAQYDEEVNEYKDRVDYYNSAAEKYNAEYKVYIDKLNRYENDVKMNQIIEAKNREYEEEYKKLSETYEKKVIAENPELKDYKMSQEEYLNGVFQWGMELQKDTTVSEWKNSMNSEQTMDQYFVNHQRKINEFNNYKIKCRNIKEVDPVQKQNYDEMMKDKIKYGKYPEHSRPFFKMLDMEDEKLNNVIDKQENVDFEFFKNAATAKMYNQIVRNELERTQRDVDFNPGNIIKFMDKAYRHDALVAMRRDEPLVKSMKVLFNEDVKMSKSIKRNVQSSLRRMLKEDDSKLANLYNSRYENTKKKAVDPIKKSVHEPKVTMKK